MADELELNKLVESRRRVRAKCRPGAGEPMPLNGLEARHALEPSDPRHRDEEALRERVSELLRMPADIDPDQEAKRKSLALQRAFLRPELSFEDLEPFRVRAAWRWVREMAILKDLVGEDQMLEDVMLDPDRMDPWREPGAGRVPPECGYLKMRADVVQMVNQIGGSAGVSILPPPVPDEWRDPVTGAVLPTYEARYDAPLRRWMDAFDRVMVYLGVARGSETNPDQGRYGLYGMLDPETVRLCFPSPFQILQLETMLVSETWHHMVRGGQVAAEKALRAAWGFSEVECVRLVRMASWHGVQRHRSDVEVDRALLRARIEEFILKVNEPPYDRRAELQALKLLTLVTGVTRGEADDFLKEVKDIMARVSGEKPPKQIGGASTAAILPAKFEARDAG